MADRLYLSLWLERHSAMNMHRNFAVALRNFPFSTQSPQCYFRVSAVDPTEPALLEQVYELPTQFKVLTDDMEKWRSSDICFEVEAFWDLWQNLPEGWRLKPTRVNLFFFGPEYPSERNESILAELGIESLFLPLDSDDASILHYYQSNIKSLLRLNAEWSDAVAVKDRRLWSESPQNLMERLQWIAQASSSRSQ